MKTTYPNLKQQIQQLRRGTRRAVYNELRWAVRNAYKPRARSRVEFARQCLRIPEGKYEGELWRPEFQPYAYHLLHLMDTSGYRRFAITGCVQSGKTLVAVVFNTLWHLFELKQSVIFIVPELTMAEKKYTDEIEPVINKSRWLRRVAYGDANRTSLPKGRGSKGGFNNTMRFANGVRLEFMGAGGSDARRSSSTAPVVVKTEVDRMDTAAESSREASAAQTVEDRTESYGDEAYIYEECTMTTEDGRINQQLHAGTCTTMHGKCPHCSHYVRPKREHFVGVEDCKSASEARESGSFQCPHCACLLTDEERWQMHENALPVSRGQTVKLDANGVGQVVGPLPDTEIFSFWWNAFDNRFWSTSRLAMKEWQAIYSDDPDDEDKQAKQKRWTEPAKSTSLDISRLTMSLLIDRQTDLHAREVPLGTKWMTAGLDVRETQLHFVVRAWTYDEGKLIGHLIDVGFLPVEREQYGKKDAVLHALRTWRDQRALAGLYRDRDGKAYAPQWSLIDAGYREQWIWQFALECASQGKPTFIPVLGRGQSDPNIRGTYTHPEKIDDNPDRTKRKVLWIGDQCHLRRSSKYAFVYINAGCALDPMYLLINTDEGKAFIRDGYDSPKGTNGSLRTFTPVTAEERSTLQEYRRQVMSESERQKYVDGRGVVRYYENTSRSPNHYGDCDNYCCFAVQLCGAPVSVRAANDARLQRAQRQDQTTLTMPDGRAYMDVSNGE